MLDVFGGRLDGLRLAEVEVADLHAELVLPRVARPGGHADDRFSGGSLARLDDAAAALLAEVRRRTSGVRTVRTSPESWTPPLQAVAVADAQALDGGGAGRPRGHLDDEVGRRRAGAAELGVARRTGRLADLLGSPGVDCRRSCSPGKSAGFWHRNVRTSASAESWVTTARPPAAAPHRLGLRDRDEALSRPAREPAATAAAGATAWRWPRPRATAADEGRLGEPTGAGASRTVTARGYGRRAGPAYSCRTDPWLSW